LASILKRGILVLLVALPAQTAAQQLQVTSNIPDDYVDSNFGVELRVQGQLAEGERLAVMIGAEDVSALFAPVSGGFDYQESLLLLPVGRNFMTIYLVDSLGEWTELESVEMMVRSLLGVETIDLKPKFSMNFSAQPWDGEDPEPTNPRDVPKILDGTAQLDAVLEHRDFDFSATGSFVATSEQARALRFSALKEEAPQFDLSSYRLDYDQGPVTATVGHIRSGNQKHLINGFGARGASLAVQANSRIDLNLAAEAGRQEVGWSNLLGVSDGDQRVMSATLGVEALENPGALRVEFGWMDGSILPRSSFNQGAITDAETSNGMSVRVTATGLKRRFRMDAGWAQSTFGNPLDPELNQGFDVIAVQEATNDARYLDASLDVLKNVKLGGSNQTASFTVGVKHERVDPLYRTVATGVRADNLQNQLDLRAVVAGITFQTMFSSAEDNLDEIPSILKSNTDRQSFNVGAPLSRIFRGETWLPGVSYRMDRTHQFGLEIPTDGGFSEGHVPDQQNVKQSVSADWRLTKFSFKYQLNHSDQDNRQAGREDADFKSLTHGFGLGVKPIRSLQLAFDLGLERSQNLGRVEQDNTRRYGMNASWRPMNRSTLSFRFSDTFKDDEASTKEQTGRTMDVKWSSKIPWASDLNGTYFVRFNRTESNRIDLIRDVTQDRSRWRVNVGASLSWAKR
jgi:hypothetical protein